MKILQKIDHKNLINVFVYLVLLNLFKLYLLILNHLTIY